MRHLAQRVNTPAFGFLVGGTVHKVVGLGAARVTTSSGIYGLGNAVPSGKDLVNKF